MSWLLRLTNASVATALKNTASAATNSVLHPSSNTSSRLQNVSLTLQSRDHLAILGRNATGKRTLCSMLIGDAATQLSDGQLEVSPECSEAKDISTISFKHTVDFLRTHGTTRVSEVLGGLNNSQDLLVRFGLTKLWYRRVRSLSTGETRKVMLAHAISSEPRILVLDRPYDGLDVESRNTLRGVIGDLARGLRPLLVANIKFKRRRPTQIVLVSHRPNEELVEEITHVAYVAGGIVTHEPLESENGPESNAVRWNNALTNLLDAHGYNYEGVDMIDSSEQEAGMYSSSSSSSSFPTFAATMLIKVRDFTLTVRDDRGVDIEDGGVHSDDLLAIAAQPKKQQLTLLHASHWNVESGKHYAMHGPNGAGKSMLLSSMLQGLVEVHTRSSRTENNDEIKDCVINNDEEQSKKSVDIVPDLRVSLVSTDVHIEAMESASEDEFCDVVLGRLYDTSNNNNKSQFQQNLHNIAKKLRVTHVLSRPFTELSQGEQRLALVAGALASRPQLLVLDEASHALDSINRNLLKQTLQNAVAAQPELCTIVVSHHEDEFIEATTHDVHIVDGVVSVSVRPRV